MFVRAGDFKVRFFSEELPHDDYPTQHCTAGSPHGEFFQTWGCYGAGITFHDPPQIFDISSDKSELYPLNLNATTPQQEQLLAAVLQKVKEHNATLEGAGVGGRQQTQLGTGVKDLQPWGCGPPPGKKAPMSVLGAPPREAHRCVSVQARLIAMGGAAQASAKARRAIRAGRSATTPAAAAPASRASRASTSAKPRPTSAARAAAPTRTAPRSRSGRTCPRSAATSAGSTRRAARRRSRKRRRSWPSSSAQTPRRGGRRRPRRPRRATTTTRSATRGSRPALHGAGAAQ